MWNNIEFHIESICNSSWSYLILMEFQMEFYIEFYMVFHVDSIRQMPALPGQEPYWEQDIFFAISQNYQDERLQTIFQYYRITGCAYRKLLYFWHIENFTFHSIVMKCYT